MLTEKLSLHLHCQTLIQQKIDTLRAVLQQIAEAKAKETKSSAGDKFETGRAMLQRQEEQHGAQLLNAISQLEQLEASGRNITSDNVAIGSLITTKKKRHYYLSIGLGKVEFDGCTYFCVSPAAPITECLLGLKVGDNFSFNNQEDQVVKLA